MDGKGAHSKEAFPRIGTIESPSLFSDGDKLLLSYEVAPVDGGGTVILQFDDVLHFEQNPMNVEGISGARFPTSAWQFTEVLDSDRAQKWQALRPRFWTVSFNDVTVEILFGTVQLAQESKDEVNPGIALMRYLGNQMGVR